MCDVISLTVKDRLKERGNIKREQGKEGEEREKFLPGALYVPEPRGQGLQRFCFCVCMLSPPETFPSLLVPMRKPKQETSLTVLLRITYYVGHRDRLCAVWGMACSITVEELRQENLSEQKQRIPINHQAKVRPNGGLLL